MRALGSILTALAIIYALLCAAALLLVPINAAGWFGMEPDPLSGVFAVLLSLPCSALLTELPNASPPLGIAIIIASMLLNLLVLLAIGRWLRRRAAAS